MYEKLSEASKAILAKKNVTPRVGLVLGSGLGVYVDTLEEKTIINYDEIPYFKQTSVEGHQGRLIFGKAFGVDIVALQGRLHAYEGHPMDEIVFPVRVLATLGIEVLILTNAAGGVNKNFSPGDLVLIDDHINMMGVNPLVGPNIAQLGPRFPDMTQTYDPQTKQYFLEAAKEMNYNLKSGVYCSLLGPTYETPAEIRMLRTLGADMVGMSTVPEAIAATHFGIKVAGISCITNMGAGMTGKKLSHEEVKTEASKVMKIFSNLLSTTIEKFAKTS